MSSRPPSPSSPAVSPAAAPRAAAAGAANVVLDSETLFAGQQTVLIRHQGEVYRLQKTRQGKLILTK
ncbi:hemin uptake protein HemP [Limnohabitans sp.]|uniref:hemin uptake protein HemP n=1 Tax=Limnohabitans sp. TaxID=1907725 RepID=UPI00311E1BB6